jgi:hypothetical protein
LFLNAILLSSVATSQVADESTEAPAPPPASEDALIQAMDSLNNEEGLLEPSNKAEKASVQDQATDPEAQPAESDLTDAAEDKICIKLKFINDDQKLVTGSLKETLGDFKR